MTVRGQRLPDEGAIVISVIDTGRGMPPEVRDRLFTKSTLSTKPGGTGLGTKIVKDVVDAHGGKYGKRANWGREQRFIFFSPSLPQEFRMLNRKR